jgi:hypothetical protein
MTEQYRTGPPEERAKFGLVPESISHEGYSARPMHSYWDNFFALRGLRDAADMAHVLGYAPEAGEFRAAYHEYRNAIATSLRLVMKAKGMEVIPGCVELGDNGGLSNTIIVSPVQELGTIPLAPLLKDFDGFFAWFERRRDTDVHWWSYLPYEARFIESFVRLGQKERAVAMMEYLLRDRRPPSWNHWAEIVWKNPERPDNIGDMPHTWAGSDFIRGFRSMLAYERDEDTTLVLVAGIPDRWLEDPAGIDISSLPTHHGTIDLQLRKHGSDVAVVVGGNLRIPPSRTVICSPLTPPVRSVTGDARPGKRQGEFHLTRFPARVTLHY